MATALVLAVNESGWTYYAVMSISPIVVDEWVAEMDIAKRLRRELGDGFRYLAFGAGRVRVVEKSELVEIWPEAELDPDEDVQLRVVDCWTGWRTSRSG
jgi:hypothetical protein